ncbi:diguanylate cyclase/phosphodiesterase (GGDEF & EAL domains) with PAS/PAC sensor [Hydrogenimonas sp.]|nr:diguanylate cyclase/phosphodiesterase (GGDEF & EAL domains) with PAS/PAC sensor [Hydrogenimonas sp.]
MLYSESQERARRFRLALRMGIPILLLVGVILIYILKQAKLELSGLDIVLILAVLFISTYFLFFLINLGQAETYIDRMTGAFNRKSLLRTLNERMKAQQPYTIVLLRLDNLPFINDHYGIDRADRMLRVFVHMLDEFLRLNEVKEAVIGRYHGGDFIVGLHLPVQKSLQLMEAFESTYQEIGHISVEYKFLAMEMDTASDLTTLINHLYDTMSQHKSLSLPKQKSEKRINPGTLEREISDAIDGKRVILHYIPTLNTNTKEVDLFEVGVKLETEQSGILPPKKFIPVVNRLGLERKFDETLFQAICKDAVKVRDNLKFSFNISPFSLRNESFVESIKKIAGEEGVSYDRMIIELFENRPIKDIKRYKVILDELRELGMEFALDNFGAQNASFEYIKRLPVDMVQFDREFTVSYGNPKIAALLSAYIKACRSMEIKTLVKWVDNEESLQRFTALGVDYLQGFAVSNRPLDSEMLTKKYGGE